MSFNEFFDWKYINEQQVAALEETLESDVLRERICGIFKVQCDDTRQNDIIVDFHFYNYAFCKEKAFDARKISTFMSIMTYVFERDTSVVTLENPINDSIDVFKALLLKHSVNRSPHSALIFTKEDARAALTYVIDNYYANFELYRFVFGKYRRIEIKQVAPGNVEYASTHKIYPLSQAVEKV